MDLYYEIITYVLAGILGLCVGSFLNVVIYRLPLGMSLATPSSHCPKCKYTLRWYDNIPVLSYIMLGGRCRSCKTHISFRYTAVEIANMLLWLLSVLLFREESIAMAVIAALSSTLFICIFFIDLEHLLIYNRFVILIGIAGVVAIFFDKNIRWYDHLIGAAAFGLFFLLIYYGAILILKREGLGFGDVKFAFVAGLLLGWQRMLFAMLIASVSASIILLIVRRARGDEKDREYPFGPFISVGVAFALLFGWPIVSWYASLLGL